MKVGHVNHLVVVSLLALALSACSAAKPAAQAPSGTSGAGAGNAEGGKNPAGSTPGAPAQSTSGNGQQPATTGSGDAQQKTQSGDSGSKSGNSSTAPSGPASPCLLSLPDAAPSGFTETGRSVVQGKGASWTLNDGANTYTVSLVFKPDAAAAAKDLETQRTLLKPYMTPLNFNGCEALTKEGKDNANKVIKVFYTHDNELVYLTVTGPNPSMDKLQALGAGVSKMR